MPVAVSVPCVVLMVACSHCTVTLPVQPVADSWKVMPAGSAANEIVSEPPSPVNDAEPAPAVKVSLLGEPTRASTSLKPTDPPELGVAVPVPADSLTETPP